MKKIEMKSKDPKPKKAKASASAGKKKTYKDIMKEPMYTGSPTKTMKAYRDMYPKGYFDKGSKYDLNSKKKPKL